MHINSINLANYVSLLCFGTSPEMNHGEKIEPKRPLDGKIWKGFLPVTTKGV
jgi:hypothetical protein